MLRPETRTARQLRREMSLPEVLLWQQLRGNRAGVKIRRQHPIGPYVVDCYCRKRRIVIEVDGECHNRGDQPERDAVRERFMIENGYRVVHLPATDILVNAVQAATAIASLVASPLHHAAHGAPPRPGED